MNVKKSSFFLICFAIILILAALLYHHRSVNTPLKPDRLLRRDQSRRRNEVVLAIEKAVPAVDNLILVSFTSPIM